MVKKTLHAVLVTTACLCTAAQSQPITNTKQQHQEAQATEPKRPNANPMPQAAVAVEPPTRHNSTSNTNEEQQPGGVSRFAHGWKGWLSRIGEDPITLFTLVLAVFTVLLWRATHRLAIGAEDTAKRQLRAYVIGKSVAIRTTEKYHQRVHVTVENFGKTPARDITYSLSILNTVDERTQPANGRLGVLAPGDSHTIITSLPAVDLDTILDGRKAPVVVFGEVQYNDGFQRRSTNFRFHQPSEATGSSGDLEMSADGNEAE